MPPLLSEKSSVPYLLLPNLDMQTLFVGRPCQHHNRDHLAKNSPAEDRVSCAISCAMGFRAGKRPTFFSISGSIDLTNKYFNQIKGLLSKVIECSLDTKVKIGFLNHQQSSTTAPHAPVLVPKRQRCHPWTKDRCTGTNT